MNDNFNSEDFGALPDNPPLDRKSAAKFLQAHGIPIQAATLAKFASVGGGPRITRFRKKPLYDKRDLLAWARSQLIKEGDDPEE